MKKVGKIISNLLLTVIVLFMLVLAASFLPLPGNFKAFVVQSGSMEPAVKTGSLIFVKPSASYAVGDIVNIKDGKNSVTHRIVGKRTDNGETVFETKGDANEEADAEMIAQSRIFGKMLWAIPYAGYPVGYAKTQMGFLLLVIIPSVIIIYEELRKIKEEIEKALLRKKSGKETAVERVVSEKIYARPSERERISMEEDQRSQPFAGQNPLKKGRKMDL